MKLLHLLNHVDRVGNGIVHVAVDLACVQARAGHEVWVASKGGAYEALLARHGVRHVRIDQSRRPLTLLRAVVALRNLLRTERIEIVHAHMVTGYLLARLLRPRASWRLVASVHNEWQRSSTLMGGADRIISMSEDAVGRLAARGMPRDRLRAVRNGTVGSPRLLDAPQDAVTLQQPAIVTVAGLYERKGIADLIAAFDHLAPQRPNAHLYLVGEGPDRARFEAQAHASAAGARIHFEGFRASPRPYLQQAAVFVLASHAEPGGLVLPEARDCGCAIVSTAVDGSPELLDQGRAGILVPARDPLALGGAISRLLDDTAERDRWRAAARDNLDWLRIERQNDETVAVYREALATSA
ncbi:MAG: glycosyltransferase family 4 protein [Gemmatimonadota bacterium]|nr:glycosyltransferase family 4 protein [Gemmatimonadota bacterium]